MLLSMAAAQHKRAGKIGPLSIAECLNWPAVIWKALLDGFDSGLLHERHLAQLARCMEGGMYFSTAYSGMGGEAMGLLFMFQEHAHLRTHLAPSLAF